MDSVLLNNSFCSTQKDKKLHCTALLCTWMHRRAFSTVFQTERIYGPQQEERTPQGNALEITVYYQLVQQAK